MDMFARFRFAGLSRLTVLSFFCLVLQLVLLLS